jgi:hypothetical protein
MYIKIYITYGANYIFGMSRKLFSWEKNIWMKF